jgi:hypothetical protein
MEPTRSLLSPTNGTRTVEPITRDAEGNLVCPNDFAHGPHSNAVWTDWNAVDVWDCSGQAFDPIES